MPHPHPLTDRVRALAEETARGTDLYVVDVVIRGGKGAPVLDVLVDTDTGVGIDELATFSRELGFALDTADVVAGRYHLNVSSPGATRPFSLPRQFPRHVGRTLDVQVRAGEPEGATEKVTGTLASVADGGLHLRTEGGAERFIPFDDVVDARVRLPW